MDRRDRSVERGLRDPIFDRFLTRPQIPSVEEA